MTADPFGPQGDHVRALIARAETLTIDEVAALHARFAALDAAGVAARVAAWAAALVAAWGAAGVAARSAAGDAAWDAAWDAAGGAGASRTAMDAAAEAAEALAVRHLIGPTFTQEHYDTLTGPWRTVVGPVHPDDVEAAS